MAIYGCMDYGISPSNLGYFNTFHDCRYPLVNFHITMENHDFPWEKTHYIYGHFQYIAM